MSKHTPGPWTYRYEGRQEWLIDAPNGDPELGYTSWEGFASVYGCVDDKTTGNIVGDANARLLAAAPELLEVLKAICDRLEQIQYDHNTSDGDLVLSEARAAIANAEGR